MGGLPAEERARGLDAYRALDADLAASGELVLSEALSPWQAKRVAVQGGRTVTTDGPFAEVKEYVAGIYVVDCDSEQRAVEIASRVPEAELGLIEVRPVVELSAFEQ